MNQREFEHRKRRLVELLDAELNRRERSYPSTQTRYVDIEDDFVDDDIIDAEFIEVVPLPETKPPTTTTATIVRSTFAGAIACFLLGAVLGAVI